MKIEIDIEELIGNALDNMDSSDYFNCVDMDDLVSSRLADMDNDVILKGLDIEELVRDRISDMSDSNILEDVDIESLVKDDIDRRDIMDDIDVEALVSDKIEDIDLLEGIDIEKIIVDHISRLIGKDDFEQYVISSNLNISMCKGRIKVLENELQAVRVELSRMNSTIINQTLCQARKWYQIW